LPSWIPRVVERIRALAAAGRVRFTLKSRQELAALSLDPDDAVLVLRALADRDARGRVRSVVDHQWLYVFKPTALGCATYVKVCLREDCIVVSFHADEDAHEDAL
jgi:hypothetical protein